MPLADKILQALKDFENEKPRSAQIKLGPSELGGCREYIRNVMVGAPMQGNDAWPTAAVVGTAVGAYLEEVCEAKLGALTEVPVTATLPSGLMVSGHADVVLVEEDAVIDGKTKDSLYDTRREGPSLENLIQVSVYRLGLIQAGILTENSTAHLIYIDRSGNDQTIHEVEIDAERAAYFIDLCEERLQGVVDVQEQIDAGNVEFARALRDKTPPFCYSEKVMCPFRDLCWKGSEWVPDTDITDPQEIADVERFVKAREMSKEADALRKEYRGRLIGVAGVTPDGYAVTWSGSEKAPALYVTKVKAKK